MQPPNHHRPLKQLLADYKHGYSLEQDFYKSPEVYRAEMQQIFLKHWVLAGHTSQLPNAGDYFLFEFDVESVIVVRTKDGSVKAHMNVCRHRGSRVCLEKQGTAQALVCPYHAWTYDLDGSLMGARQMADDFDKSVNGLHPVHLKMVGGLIFISLAENPLSLDTMFADLENVFDLFGFDNMKVAHHQSYAIDANWKLAVENYQECYHCAPSHPEFAKIHAMAGSPAKFQACKESYLASLDAAAASTKTKTRESNAYFDLAEAGDEGYQYGRNPLLQGALSGSHNQGPVAPLLGKLEGYDGGASEFMLGPMSYFLIYDDHMLAYRFTPTSIDTCKGDLYWFVRSDAVEGKDYDKEKLTWLWDVTIKADEEIIVNNQKGVNSHFYAPGRLSDMEYFEQHFLNWYLQAIGSYK